MTVAELIECLTGFDRDLQVTVRDNEDGDVIVDGAATGTVHPPPSSKESLASRESRARTAIRLVTGGYASDRLFPEEANK